MPGRLDGVRELEEARGRLDDDRELEEAFERLDDEREPEEAFERLDDDRELEVALGRLDGRELEEAFDPDERELDAFDPVRSLGGDSRAMTSVGKTSRAPSSVACSQNNLGVLAGGREMMSFMMLLLNQPRTVSPAPMQAADVVVS